MTSDKTTLCGAQAWRYFVYEGWFVDNKFTTDRVTCTMPQGHEGDHKGYLAFRTGRGKVNAIVSW